MKLVGLALALVLLLSAVLSPSQATPDARADPNPFFFKKKYGYGGYGHGGYGHGGYGGYGHGGYGGYGHGGYSGYGHGGYGGYGGYGIRKYW
ncbi:keratin-associated protein 19-2-like isoform X3 [Penaeus monodon]|uniref:keratin-associated protein 19-2-like isoform X3 n=1 Tax=Penaeus monodon TaxID=6687 RepID=UPI0018A75E6F|nr:keratin-associated protein 19-2-like isoform X3 [Penaeus monodon]